MQNKVLTTVLGRIRPTKEEEDALIKLANDVISKIKIKDCKIKLGGSGAKGTWLKGTHDIDFLAVPELKERG
ncbi:nucleotidyltransferase domain-containing protein [Candidatus Woesearchaeota archaeon]|nr:nucleotidyltransferase domain-containing protein [Candidatus Woesearchaeota archaeon]